MNVLLFSEVKIWISYDPWLPNELRAVSFIYGSEVSRFGVLRVTFLLALFYRLSLSYSSRSVRFQFYLSSFKHRILDLGITRNFILIYVKMTLIRDSLILSVDFIYLIQDQEIQHQLRILKSYPRNCNIFYKKLSHCLRSTPLSFFTSSL